MVDKINIMNEDLFMASYKGNIEKVISLLDDGAEINSITRFGGTSLYIASQVGHNNIVKLLLQRGANPEIPSINGMLPLRVATENGHIEVLISLLEARANPNNFEDDEVTPLVSAAYFGNADAIKILLKYGANKSLGTKGFSAIQLAGTRGHKESFDVLVDKMSSNYVFSNTSIDEIALISMVKNEEDIIYENLFWHFALGFRKFVIVDNLSTDLTRTKIEEFSRITKNHATVIFIEDPIFEHIQSRIMTGAYNFVRAIWPEVEWVFPTDADEFWIPQKGLRYTLSNLPENVDALKISATRYYASQDYNSFDQSAAFYEKLHFRSYSMLPDMPKIIARAQNNMAIDQGNHFICNISEYNYPAENGFLCNEKTRAGIKYVDAHFLGIEMYEFPMRSINQIHSKFFNGMRVCSEAKKKKFITDTAGYHWSAYASYLEKYGENAAETKFNESLVDKRFAVDDPLPIGEAIEFVHILLGSLNDSF